MKARVFIISILTVLLFQCSFQGMGQKLVYPQNYFRSPLDIDLVLSGTFGELRSNHFHSGMDIKTNGVEGLPVYSIAEGYVSRIKVSPYGFGKALYVVHPNGYTSVYAHLRNFNDSIEAYLKTRQYNLQQNEVDIYLKAAELPVGKGDVIAFSGNSGGSGGPHLHFEIRDSRTEHIINPLLFGYEVKDTRYPELSDLNVYEYADDELISNTKHRIINRGKGDYYLAGNGTVEVSANVGFGIGAIDRQDGAWNRNGVYKIEMLVNGKPFYNFTMNTFSFAETRFINSHIDFSQRICCGKRINKLYLDPNNQLSIYADKSKMKLLSFEEDSLFEVSILVSDIAGNTSKLNFKVRRTEDIPLGEALPTEIDLPLFRHDQSNFYVKNKLSVVLPNGALYRDIYFEHEVLEPCGSCLSEVHQVSSELIPVQKSYKLSIRTTDLPPDINTNKLAIASLKEGIIEDFEGGTFSNGTVTTNTRQFGQFAVVADTSAPSIESVNFDNGSVINAAKDALLIKVHDNFSGVDSYRAYFDESWVRMYYDAKNKLMIIRESDLPSKPGKFTLTIEVTDKRDNKATESYKIVRS